MLHCLCYEKESLRGEYFSNMSRHDVNSISVMFQSVIALTFADHFDDHYFSFIFNKMHLNSFF